MTLLYEMILILVSHCYKMSYRSSQLRVPADWGDFCPGCPCFPAPKPGSQILGTT